MFIINPISYPGNKNKLIKYIQPYIPNNLEVLVDVFCGSAVVAVNSSAKKIICNDISVETIEILKYFYCTKFETILNTLENIISAYNLTYSRIKPKGFYKEIKHEGLSRYNKSSYNKLKDDYNKEKSIEKLIILLIYGFNHYIRFNSKKQFNVPVGKVDFSNSIHMHLKHFVTEIKKLNIAFSTKDFRNKNLYLNKKAFYYFDPPYLITNAPYNNKWNEKDEKDLLNILDNLNKSSTKFALSNVLTSNGKKNHLLIEWSKKYNVINMHRQYRNANYQKINIEDTKEVLITNY